MAGIDPSFDFRTDAASKDPDSHSPTLGQYHRQLWGKQLPCGRPFELTIAGHYLQHRSELGEFLLASDSIIASFTRWTALKHITEHFPEAEHEAFRAIGYTIGGMMIFPANKIDGKQINGDRGLSSQIRRPLRSHTRMHPPPLSKRDRPAR